MIFMCVVSYVFTLARYTCAGSEAAQPHPPLQEGWRVKLSVGCCKMDPFQNISR